MALGCKTSLLSFDKFPPAMENYLQNYGFHFSKKAFEWAASIMKKRNPSNGREEEVVPMGKEETSDLLSRYGVSVENNVLLSSSVITFSVVFFSEPVATFPIFLGETEIYNNKYTNIPIQATEQVFRTEKKASF